MNKVKDWLRYLIFTCIISLSVAQGYAQKLPFVISFSNNSNSLGKKIEGEADSLEFENRVKLEVKKYLKKGYLLASAQIQRTDSVRSSSIYVGDIFRWGRFNVDEVPESLLSKAGYRKNQFVDVSVNAPKLGTFLSRIIHESETHGFPFTHIRLDSVEVSGNTLFAKIKYTPGAEIKYADLEVSNNAIVKSKYLERYLEVNKGDLFDSRKIDEIPGRIKRLPYCKLEKPPVIKFENKSCKINLPLLPLKANKIDAMIGLAPNQLDNNRLLATGHIDLNLQNLFKSGKELSFNWRQYGFQSQKLTTLYNHTNLFGSVINVKGAFDLLKQDTSFINRNFYLTIGYDRANYTINITSRYQASRLLTEVTADSQGLVPEIDFDAQYYGLEFLKNVLDDKINPTRGWSLLSWVNLGAKKIQNTQFVPAEAYAGLDEQMLQGGISIAGELAIPISALFVGYTKISAATIETSGELFNNDLFRLGGINSIRGFNEMEIYASSYGIIQLEGRLLLGPASRLFGFVDWAITDNTVSVVSEQYVGLGGGMHLETPAGAIQLVLAVGKSAQQSLSLTESKIHLGYVAKF